MIKRISLLFLAVACLALAACNDDTTRPKKEAPPAQTFQDLTEKSHVLNNLRLAMTQMNAMRYVELLDSDDFVFHFDPADVGGGIPATWGFTEDSTSAANMLGGQGSNPIISVDLELVGFENAVWDEFDPVGSPGLYRATVSYNFFFETSRDIQYITSGRPQAQFTIAQKDVGGTMVWRLVTWKDDSSAYAASARAFISTEETSWGKVKALYR